MALAVENAEVVLIGVSRQYKESTNCRLEAQYAMQREVPTIPLLLEDGYRADGWLGMLIGTRMWYGFFGPVLTEASLFEGKVSELCRDLGDRGRGNTVGVSVGDRGHGSGGGGHCSSRAPALRSELSALKVGELRKRALEAGVSSDAVEAVYDSDDPKAALIELLVVEERVLDDDDRAGGGDAALRSELSALKAGELRKRALEAGVSSDAVEAVYDSDDPKAALIELLVVKEHETPK